MDFESRGGGLEPHGVVTGSQRVRIGNVVSVTSGKVALSTISCTSGLFLGA